MLTKAENQSRLSRRRNELLRKMTKAERHVMGLLAALGENFIPQKGFMGWATHVIVDFYLPKRGKLCLEVDGGVHLSPERQNYDQRRDSFLINERGFRVLRITNEEAFALKAIDLYALLGRPTEGRQGRERTNPRIK